MGKSKELCEHLDSLATNSAEFITAEQSDTVKKSYDVNTDFKNTDRSIVANGPVMPVTIDETMRTLVRDYRKLKSYWLREKESRKIDVLNDFIARCELAPSETFVYSPPEDMVKRDREIQRELSLVIQSFPGELERTVHALRCIERMCKVLRDTYEYETSIDCSTACKIFAVQIKASLNDFVLALFESCVME